MRKVSDSMVNNIMNLPLDVVKMETLFEKAFHEIDLPTNEMGMASIAQTIGDWRKLTKEKFPKKEIRGFLNSFNFTAQLQNQRARVSRKNHIGSSCLDQV